MLGTSRQLAGIGGGLYPEKGNAIETSLIGTSSSFHFSSVRTQTVWRKVFNLSE